MNIDIANIVSEQITPKEWIGYLISFASVFLGAYFAYRFNNVQEKQQDKKKRAEAYDDLLSQVSLLTTELFKYKEIYFNRVKKAYDKDDYPEALLRTYDINMTLNPNLNNCHFISGYNKCFLTEVSRIKDIGKAIETDFRQYNQKVDRAVSILNTRNFKEEYLTLKCDYYNIYKDYEIYVFGCIV